MTGVQTCALPICKLAAQRFPLLQLFRPLYQDVDTLLIDDELGAYLAVKHLLQSGHRKIMLITRSNPILVKREEGYARAYREAGIPMDQDCICLMTYIDNIKDMLKSRIREVNPTAILSVGERISVNVVQALREMNLDVPGDMSLIVYDDLAWTAAFDITAVSHSFEAIGNLASELIVGRLKEVETGAVSYTHLDVYKRQVHHHGLLGTSGVDQYERQDRNPVPGIQHRGD